VRLVDQVLRLQPVFVETAQRGRPTEIEAPVARRERGVVELENAPRAAENTMLASDGSGRYAATSPCTLKRFTWTVPATAVSLPLKDRW